MPPLFHNPYHFVPVSPGTPPETVPLDDFTKPHEQRQAPHLTHDRFVPGTHSGRLVCKLTVESPLICGNEQIGNEVGQPRHNWTKLIKQFELEPRVPALPGSALRGMISSLAEAASHSALRVLENRRMSYRRQVSEGLSAIGLVVEQGGRLWLYPLAEPHLDQRTGEFLPRGDHANYGLMFPNRRPKVYFGEQDTIGTARFLASYKSNATPPGGPFYAVNNSWLIPKVKGGRFRLGEMLSLGAEHQVRPWLQLTATERASGQWVRGILRVLGRYEQRVEALPTKKHEFFLRFSEQEQAALAAGTATIFPLEPEAVTRFNQLADERAEAENTDATAPEELMPYTPHGAKRECPREADRPPSSWRLKAGDIVFFRPSENGRSVVEISLSSAWRGRVERAAPRLSPAAPLWSFFDPNLVPLSPGRTLLTLAEQLFGAVELRDKKQQEQFKDKPAFAFASRLRVSHGVLHSAPPGGAYQPARELWSPEQQTLLSRTVPDVPLKNLASPKPPSPALYFKPRLGQARYIPKNALNPVSHAPQGRKFYLRRNPDSYHATSEAFVHPARLGSAEERQAIAKQHQSVQQLVRPATTFFFHLDFDNLSSLELQLLTYVLQPSDSFRHQLGHGKPLGLGQVRIEIVGLLGVNRPTRYRGDLTAPRWHTAWASGNPAAEWPIPLRRHLPEQFNPLPAKVGELKSQFEAWAEAKHLTPVLRALERLGKPLPAQAQVHYPQTADVSPEDADFEQEHYRWFVQNDDPSHQHQPGQFLAPLVNSLGQVAAALPTLDREQRDAPPATAYSGAPQSQGDGGGGGTEAPPNPQALLNQIVEDCVVEAHDRPKHRLQIRFLVTRDTIKLPGLLENPMSIPKAELRYPVGWRGSMKVVNLQKTQSGLLCTLRPVP